MTSRYIKRFTDIEIILPSPPAIQLGGVYHGEVYKCREMMDGRSIEIPGTRRLVLAHSDNIVTDTGLDHIGNHVAFAAYAHVGTGGAAESTTDNTLDTYVTSHAADGSYGGGYGQLSWTNQSAPYWGNAQQRYRFPPGFAGGAINIAEVGVSTQAATGNLFSRALVRTGGVPTVAPVANDEYFDLYYTLRNYPGHVNNVTGALDDGTGTVDIGGTTYNYTIRVSFITTNTLWGRNLFSGFNLSTGNQWYTRGEVAAPTATLGAINQGLQSTEEVAGYFYTVAHALGTYTNGTYTNSITYTQGLDDYNLLGGIQGFAGWSSICAYQWILDGAVPKDNTKVLNWGFQGTWTRHTL